MNTTYGPHIIKSVNGSVSAPDVVTGLTTKFLSITVAGEIDAPYLWAFADDFQTLPVVGQNVVFTVAIRAKVKDGRGRLSVRVLSFKEVA